MSLIIIAIFLCLLIFVFRLRKTKGKIGEKKVAHILTRLPKDQYRIINDLLIRTPSGNTTQIDHIVISEYAIFVIETKNYQGMIYGGEYSEYWTQNIFGNKYQLRNPIIQNHGHIRAIKALLQDYGKIPYVSIVAFSRQASLGVTANSPVIYWDQILAIINQFEEKRISHIQVVGIYNKLLESNTDSKATRKEHICNVRSNEQKRDTAVASGKCPVCGGSLVLRNGKYGTFYGCSNYPRCRYTLKQS